MQTPPAMILPMALITFIFPFSLKLLYWLIAVFKSLLNSYKLKSCNSMTKMSTDEKSSQQTTQWTNLLTDLFDRLTGKGAEIAYNFERLEIDVPRAAGPQGQELGSAKWILNGRLTITARTQTGNTGNRGNLQ
jgi:hypothetical protein